MQDHARLHGPLGLLQLHAHILHALLLVRRHRHFTGGIDDFIEDTSCGVGLTLDLTHITTKNRSLWASNNFNIPKPTLQRDLACPFRQPVRVFSNPFDANEVWVSSFGGGLRVGYSTAPVATPLFANGFE